MSLMFKSVCVVRYCIYPTVKGDMSRIYVIHHIHGTVLSTQGHAEYGCCSTSFAKKKYAFPQPFLTSLKE